MMKTILGTILFLVLNAASAQESCLSEATAKKRLACYDKASGYKPPESEAKVPDKLPPVRLILRNKAALDHIAVPQIGSKGAQLSLVHEDGEDSITAEMGALAVFRPINDAGWQPFALASWNHNDGSEPKTDTRDVGFGIAGSTWSLFNHGWTLFMTPRIARRINIYERSHSDIASVHTDVIVQPWVDSPEDPEGNSFALVPMLGYVTEDRHSLGSDRGRWSGGYAGVTLNTQWNAISPRLQSSVSYQYFADSSVPTGNEKRDDAYGRISMSFEFTNPDDPDIRIRPAVFLTREFGSDPLNGIGKTNTTEIGFGITVN